MGRHRPLFLVYMLLCMSLVCFVCFQVLIPQAPTVQVIVHLATKEDLVPMATRALMVPLATREGMIPMATTSPILAPLATKALVVLVVAPLWEECSLELKVKLIKQNVFVFFNAN